MGLFSFITGSLGRKNVTSLINGGISAADKLFFTKEEKADYLSEIGKNYIEYYKLTMNENTSRSLTRRYLSIMIMGTFLFLIIFSGAIYLFNKDWAAFVFSLAKELTSLATMVGVFFFGLYATQKYVIDPLKAKRKVKKEEIVTNKTADE